MASVVTSRMTAEEFFEWATLPNNEDRIFELDEGKVIEMPSPGVLRGVICFLIARILGNYLFEHSRGYFCSNDSGLLVQRDPDTLRGPDLMVFLDSKQFDQFSRRFTEDIPQLIVEVRSPNDRPNQMEKKITQYLRRGISLVWLVDPEDQTVSVRQPKEFTKVLEGDDELTGNGVLPDFRYKVADLFRLPGQSN